jgi:hypothetical protein
MIAKSHVQCTSTTTHTKYLSELNTMVDIIFPPYIYFNSIYAYESLAPILSVTHRFSQSHLGFPDIKTSRHQDFKTSRHLCTTFHNFAQLFTTLHNFSLLCTTLHNFATLCTTLHNFVQLCITLHNFAQHTKISGYRDT